MVITPLENFINRIQTGLESIQTLIFIGAFRTGKSKSQLIIEARMLLVNHKSTSNNLLL
jgi:hypothetical protein